MRYKSLVGKRYTRLIVIQENGRNKHGNVMWLCQCDCGNQLVVSTNSLNRGNTRSCGCLHRDYLNNPRPNSMKHGCCNTRLYTIWRDMKLRCYNASQVGYKNYGGRGIVVCNGWLNSFENFYNWAINNGYKDNLTLDRIDNDGNYEPDNCRWITNLEQSNHKRNNKYVTYNGETKTIAEWSRELSISYHLIWNRLKNGWLPPEIFERRKKK